MPGAVVRPAPGRSSRPTRRRTTRSCGTEFDRRYNPSNTGNIRLSSRFTFGGFTLTVDPSYQYVKANGGGTVTGNEGLRDINPAVRPAPKRRSPRPPVPRHPHTRVQHLRPRLSRRLALLRPRHQRRRRHARHGDRACAEPDPDPPLRPDRRRSLGHQRRSRRPRQLHLRSGAPPPDRRGRPARAQRRAVDVFPINDPQADVHGVNLQKRDRLSFAILHQFSAEYRGEFLDGKLVVNAGLRAPFFKRDLNNFCAASSPTFVECFGRDDPRYATFADAQSRPSRARSSACSNMTSCCRMSASPTTSCRG